MTPTILHAGKRYTRTDRTPDPSEPERSQPPRPYDICIKGDWGKTAGLLGISRVVTVDTTVQAVIYPNRGGAYNPRIFQIRPRETYVDFNEDPRWMFDVEQGLVYKEECTLCGIQQKRGAFSPDPRKKNGLQSHCKSCRAQYAAMNRNVA